jgi:hypothetical protein
MQKRTPASALLSEYSAWTRASCSKRASEPAECFPPGRGERSARICRASRAITRCSDTSRAPASLSHPWAKKTKQDEPRVVSQEDRQAGMDDGARSSSYHRASVTDAPRRPVDPWVRCRGTLAKPESRRSGGAKQGRKIAGPNRRQDRRIVARSGCRA